MVYYFWGLKAAGYCESCSYVGLTCISEQRASLDVEVHPLSNEDDAYLCYTSRAIYKYEPIREGDDFRLLCLRPGKPGDIIRADLETVSVLARRHYYDAISYTWADENGDSTKCCSLEIGSPGVLLPITRNCDSVLRRVRKHTERVWIDAVCIDQDNVRERGQQVDLMPRIYKSAVRTFVYVGEASGESELVLRNLAGGIWTPPHLLDSFFARPYFTRVWVVQEVALSKAVTMMCGDTAVEWTGFMRGEYLRQIYSSSYYETFPTLFRLGRQHHLGAANVLDALLLGRSCKASDPRDKVFGLLRMMSEESRPLADYSLSTAEVYTQTAMYLLEVQEWGLDVTMGNLCHRSDEARTQTPNLPSWVPDWTQCGSTLLQRVPLGIPFLADQDAILEYNGESGLFLEGRIFGTLKTFEEHSDIVQISIHLSSSWSRASQKLPPAYRDRRVYVFSPYKHFTNRSSPLLEEWKHAGSNSLKSIPWTALYREYAFLFAHINSGEAAKPDLPAQQEGKSQKMLETLGDAEEGSRPLATGDATPRKMATGLRDGSDGANNFEFLGLVQVQSKGLHLLDITSRFEDIYQTIYTRAPCTIRIL
ncbi:hypothetical protein LA080_004877 [Diaporthe eres]|nr:hypothetical protein LA080_004877 [Diaporthe eres]